MSKTQLRIILMGMLSAGYIAHGDIGLGTLGYLIALGLTLLSENQ